MRVYFLYIAFLNINLENSAKFYYMIEETLNFLIQINDYSDLLVNRMKMQCLLKISIFIKKEIITKYPLVLDFLIKICQEISGFYLYYAINH